MSEILLQHATLVIILINHVFHLEEAKRYYRKNTRMEHTINPPVVPLITRHGNFCVPNIRR